MVLHSVGPVCEFSHYVDVYGQFILIVFINFVPSHNSIGGTSQPHISDLKEPGGCKSCFAVFGSIHYTVPGIYMEQLLLIAEMACTIDEI